MNVFESVLPAGANSYKGNKTTDYCILDCIYDQTTFTYYVLDLMCWKGHPIYDCDTEFRLAHFIHCNLFFTIIINCQLFEKFLDFIGSTQNLQKSNVQLQTLQLINSIHSKLIIVIKTKYHS